MSGGTGRTRRGNLATGGHQETSAFPAGSRYRSAPQARKREQPMFAQAPRSQERCASSLDEAQDLHPAQWRLLRAAVPPGPDDMFIVGDVHQRIYENHVSLVKVGINVRGRSRRLTVNYRTTQEILALAVPAPGKAPVTGLDDEADSLAGYRSPLGKQASAALEAAGIATVSLAAKSAKHAVRVGTMHGMKGLEFQAVAVFGVADGVVPAPAAVTAVEEDALAHAQDLQRERCLLFVACTRARDHLYVSYSGSPSPFLDQR
jgi:superfamily I DNA/RNA helicase